MTTVTSEKTLSKNIAPKSSRIEENVPLPKYTRMSGKDELVEDLRKMRPLQSRVIEMDFNKANVNKMRTRIHEISKNYSLQDRKFTVNVDPETGTKLRVWRVS